MEGLTDRLLDQFIAWQDDEWERTSRVVSMIHNTTRSESRDCKPPAEFNDLKKWLDGAGPEPDEIDDLEWVRIEEAKKARKKWLTVNPSRPAAAT